MKLEKMFLVIDISEELVQDKIDRNIIKNAIIGDASDEKKILKGHWYRKF